MAQKDGEPVKKLRLAAILWRDAHGDDSTYYDDAGHPVVRGDVLTVSAGLNLGLSDGALVLARDYYPNSRQQNLSNYRGYLSVPRKTVVAVMDKCPHCHAPLDIDTLTGMMAE